MKLAILAFVAASLLSAVNAGAQGNTGSSQPATGAVVAIGVEANGDLSITMRSSSGCSTNLGAPITSDLRVAEEQGVLTAAGRDKIFELAVIAAESGRELSVSYIPPNLVGGTLCNVVAASIKF